MLTELLPPAALARHRGSAACARYAPTADAGAPGRATGARYAHAWPGALDPTPASSTPLPP